MSPVASLRERQAEQVRTAILEATAGLLDTAAVGDISMSDVAAAAGLSLRTLYRYFPDRSELLQAAGEHVYSALGVPIVRGRDNGAQLPEGRTLLGTRVRF